MKNYVLKSVFVLSFIFAILGFMRVGVTEASASMFDIQDSIITDQTNQATVITETYGEEGLVQPFAEIGPTYPGTNVQMRIGDILYSTKTLGSSSQIVGHTGIVNSDFKVVHVTYPVNGGTIDNMTGYMNRHGAGETIRVYRPTNGMGVSAAKWATWNFIYVKEYFINPFSKLGTLSPNYCSKFVWQAFYYGEGIDLTNVNNTPDLVGFVTPSMVINSPFVIYMTSFKAV
ncbi:peptidoglycan amidohydrolase family protein [Paenibacillus piscarius]|uniref:peptidoglycan amidohydrolase family protein n=1 Tax=Paenibacillus piscarius TaxID=1089681 RepID=UPI001EE907F4|nr:peptidoglycan amidohydrolase family protein [Paenibacillus piscarius]